MRDYEEFPENLSLNTLYYIGNPSGLTAAGFDKLHQLFLKDKYFFSVEKLLKGKERAVVLYGPRDLAKSCPELSLVEIEDYLGENSDFLTPAEQNKKVNVNLVLSWLVEPKNNPKKLLHIESGAMNFTLEDDQKVFIQMVLMPIQKSGENVFQSTFRVMVSDPDAIKRIELAKKVGAIFNTATGLNKHEDSFPETKKYDSYKQRSLIPKEVAEFMLTQEEVISFIS